MKSLPLITHAVVHFTDRSVAQNSNIFGTMVLCFGPGDDSGISGFRLVKVDQGRYVWRPPHSLSGEAVFYGAVATELATRVHEFWKTFMEQTERGSKFGRSYRISQHKVEEIAVAHTD